VTPTKGSTKSPSKSSSKSSSKSPSQSPSQSPSNSSSKSPTRGPAKGSAKTATKSPARSATKSPAKAPARSPAGRAASRPPIKIRVEDLPQIERGPAPGGRSRPEASVADIGPHLEARREREGRSGFRRYAWRFAIVVAIGGLGVGAWALLHSSLFGAKVVTVTGPLTAEQRAEVLAASGLSTHPPLIDVNPGAIGARVSRIPWVANARVSRHWPDGVSVSVGRRVPVAVMARPGGGYVEVDRTGRILSASASAPAGLAQLKAPVRAGPVGSWLAASASPSLAVAASLPPALRPEVAAVVAQPQGEVDLQLTSPLTVRLGTVTQLRQKYEAAAAILAGASLQAGDVIDATVPQTTFVGPQQSG
jgi:cell division protein FtsQ